ncbi:hypothetical protein HanRHA438_Chr02g0090951 [Helianthus annuus]|nr:hypothetical protein HanRHA438_Chr02g0090951 [Helianthus annuus]
MVVLGEVVKFDYGIFVGVNICGGVSIHKYAITKSVTFSGVDGHLWLCDVGAN